MSDVANVIKKSHTKIWPNFYELIRLKSDFQTGNKKMRKSIKKWRLI